MLIAWPVLLGAAALVALPFVGAFVVIRSLRSDDSSHAAAERSDESTPSRELEDTGEAEAEPTNAG